MIGFKGKGGAFDQDAFERYAKSKGHVPVTVDSVDEAKKLLAGHPGKFGVYGFSLGAENSNRLLADPELKKRLTEVTTIGAFRSANLSNLENTNWNNYPDKSSGAIQPRGEGFQLTGHHMQGPGTVASAHEKKGATLPTQGTMPVLASHIEEAQGQEAAIRRMAIGDQLRKELEYAGSKTGLIAHIYSGGQEASGPHRTGSHRHDEGGAADLKLYDPAQKRFLDMRNPEDAKRMSAFVSYSVAAGASGVGAGVNHMGPSGIHIGGGKPATWGGAPWIRGAWAAGRGNPASEDEMRSAGIDAATAHKVRTTIDRSYADAVKRDIETAGTLKADVIAAPNVKVKVTTEGKLFDKTEVNRTLAPAAPAAPGSGWGRPTAGPAAKGAGEELHAGI